MSLCSWCFSSSCLRGYRGFTLVELILVLVVIAILAAVAAPALSGVFPSIRTQTTVEEIVASARKARHDAALTGRRHRLTVVPAPEDGPAYHYVAFERDPLRLPGVFRPAPGLWGRARRVPEGVILEVDEGAGATGVERWFEFGPDGTATEGTIAVVDEDRVREIRVEGAGGRITVEAPGEDRP